MTPSIANHSPGERRSSRPGLCFLLRGIFSVAVATVLLGALGTVAESAPGELEGPILLVPAVPGPVSLTVTLPNGSPLKPGEAVELVEVDAEASPVTDANDTLAGDILPGIGADGTPAEPGRLAAVIPERQGAASPRRFALRRVTTGYAVNFVLEDIDGRSLLVKDVAELGEGRVATADSESNGGESESAAQPAAEPVFRYNYGVITAEDVPEREHRRRRGCYIHPVWGLHGEVFTDDFPRDHYHHHGIFWTWPHVDFLDDDKGAYDSWQKDELWQEYDRWLARQIGRVSAVIGVENRWMADRDKPRHVMTERMWMQAYRDVDGGRAIDLRLTLDPRKGPVKLWGAGGKSYGGITMRFIGIPHKDQVVTTPDGPSTQDRKMTPLRWVDFARQFAGAPNRTGAALMIHPDHPDFPPTWLTRTYGPQCVGWPGVKPRTLEPGNPVTLPCRVFIHDQEMTTEQLEAAYAAFVAGTQARWE
jgi:hypothetical protein